MYLFDTDSATLALRGQGRIRTHIIDTPPESIWMSGIAVEEMVKGALASINYERSRSGSQVETASRFFLMLIEEVARFQLLPYTNQAERLFQSWPAAVRRVGPNDCRIAASAIVHGYTVVTCNGKDFSRIPGVTFEDWSQ